MMVKEAADIQYSLNNENLTYDDVFQDMISSNMIDIESAGYVVLDIL